ncbi:tetratricopeptide (TPR) repeat protein [Flavobacterium sp. CG_23.5]|uniref:tetratricopeptide repeat protein n=1 Tax=Flavobacterium sp. CG_23.5 TaxID=2760708 RepID=UPI001AE77037|nr:tetratricopeptide repeat protein [Flavobacterium sp. CG_23.5]MBP2281801.1 tetratricopeptide (TPR) repeat protein [Flavobacterium sp. CG_23.5]
MRNILHLLLILISVGNSFGQSKDVKEIENTLSFNKEYTTNIVSLIKASSENTNINPTKSIDFAEEALLESKKIKSLYYEMQSLNKLGFALFVTGNYSRGLKISLQGQQLAEKLNDNNGILSAYNNIGNIYRRQGNYNGAIATLLLAKKLLEEKKLSGSNIISTLGICYLETGQTDLAIKYLQDAYQQSLRVKSDQISIIYNRLGDLQSKLNNIPLALEYYRLGVATATEREQYRWLCFNYLSLATLYFNQKQTDSSIVYAQKAISIGKHKFLHQTQKAAIVLSDSYNQLKQSDSCLKYLRMAMTIKDTIQNNKEESEIQNLLFEDRLQKIEVAEEKVRLAEERAHNLQYSAIAVTLILFVITFLIFSHSKFANKATIRFLGILSLLIIFEFINLLLHPYLGGLVHHSPILMLSIMVLIASLLIPLHHKLEHWITEKLIEKNNKIRLAAAKKVIEQIGR